MPRSSLNSEGLANGRGDAVHVIWAYARATLTKARGLAPAPDSPADPNCVRDFGSGGVLRGGLPPPPGAVAVDKDRVQRGLRGNIEAIATRPPEADISD